MSQIKKADRERLIEVVKNNSDQVEVLIAKSDLAWWYYKKTHNDLMHIANIPCLDMLAQEANAKSFLEMFPDNDFYNELLDHFLEHIISARAGLIYLENAVKAEQENRRKRRIKSFKIIEGGEYACREYIYQDQTVRKQE